MKKVSVFLIYLFLTLVFITGNAYSSDISIDDYILISKTRVSRVDYAYTYKAIANNFGDDLKKVKAVVSSSSPNTTVLDDDLSFGDIMSGESKESDDTFVIKQNRSYTFDEKSLVWDIKHDENLTNHAFIGGHLAGAKILVYKLDDMMNPVGNPIYTTNNMEDIRSSGIFTLNISGLADDDFVLIEASEGYDLDVNGDGLIDEKLSPNNGSICALLTVADINEGNFNISMISDLFWRYTENFIDRVDQKDLSIRLNDLAKIFFKDDINGDRIINYLDALSFSPLLTDNKNKLNFDYSILFKINENTNSIVNCYHSNDVDNLLRLLNDFFGNYLSLYSMPDIRYDKVKIEVAVLGNGSFSSDKGEIVFSNYNNKEDNKIADFFERSENDIVKITAHPDFDHEILSWSGCDEVSEDLSECICSLSTNHLVSLNFGYKETIIRENVRLVDLSETLTTINEDQTIVNVTAGHGDQDMVDNLASIEIGDAIVGSAGGGFLLKVTSTDKTSDYKYTFQTTDINLEEIIEQGTGILSKRFMHEDLLGGAEQSEPQIQSFRTLSNVLMPELPATTPDSDLGDIVRFEGIDGVKLLPPERSNDDVFRIVIDSEQTNNVALRSFALEESEGGTAEWELAGGSKVTAKGEVKLSFSLETGVSYNVFGIQHLKFIPKFQAEESLEVSIGDEIKTDKLFPPIRIGTIYFSPIVFMIGPVPVWVQVSVPINLEFSGKISAKAEVSTTLTQKVETGFVWHNDFGVNWLFNFDSSWQFLEPSVELSGEVKAFIEPAAAMKVYSAIGPESSLDGYLKLKGEVDAIKLISDGCTEGTTLSLFGGVESKLKWDTGVAGKFGKLIGFDDSKIEKTIYIGEFLFKKWNVGGLCGHSTPFLEVDGLDVFEYISENNGGWKTYDYTLRNTGTASLDWEIRHFEDEITYVSHKSGTLKNGESQLVTISIDTDRLGIGNYQNNIQFINNYDSGLAIADSDGTTTRTVYVDVAPLPLAAPEISAVMYTDQYGVVVPSLVDLSWIFPNNQTFKYVEGYIVYKTTTPNIDDSWEKVVDITAPSTFQYRVSNLYSNTTYYFQILAYGSGVTTTEDTMKQHSVSIKTPNIDPQGDCRAHFTGALMGDHFERGWLTEVYVEDIYSEYVGAGWYALNRQAFPKATGSSFDGIAIDAGTKITIYSQPNYTGGILYEKVGPAIINNGKWAIYSQYYNGVMANWKEPLQSTYPQDVREWSNTNMHLWPSGSMLIECGY